MSSLYSWVTYLTLAWISPKELPQFAVLLPEPLHLGPHLGEPGHLCQQGLGLLLVSLQLTQEAVVE